MGDTGQVTQGSAYIPPCSPRVIVSRLALSPCFRWRPIPLEQKQWLLGAEEELGWAGRRAWIAHCCGNFHVEIYRDPGNQSPAEQSHLLLAVSGSL